MLYLGGKAETPEAGALLSDELLKNGEAYKYWLKIVAAHGGDTSHFANPAAFHTPGATRVLTARTSGYLSSMDCTQVGWAVQRLGAGRAKPGDPVSANAGIEMHVKLGDEIKVGQPLVTLFADREEQLNEPEQMLLETMKIATDKPILNRLIREVIVK
jgi:pyrimidine-nucleoside phosphorylase